MEKIEWQILPVEKNDKNEDGYGARQKCRGWWVAAAVCTNLAHCGALTVVAAGSIWEKVKRVQWTLSGSKVSPSTSLIILHLLVHIKFTLYMGVQYNHHILVKLTFCFFFVLQGFYFLGKAKKSTLLTDVLLLFIKQAEMLVWAR